MVGRGLPRDTGWGGGVNISLYLLHNEILKSRHYELNKVL